MTGPQPPVSSQQQQSQAPELEFIPAVMGAIDYYSLVNVQGAPRLCIYDKINKNWRILEPQEMRQTLSQQNAPPSVMQMF